MKTLKGILADCDITQRSLAKILGISRSTLSRKMKTRNFTVREIRRICDYLKIYDPREIYEIFLR